MRFAGIIICACVLIPAPALLHAQRRSVELSEIEEEQVRSAADDPATRVTVFQKIIDARAQRIQEILADKRAQGRMEDIHDNMDQIAGLGDELEDNLNDYDRGHKDVRRSLPKLLEAIDRWQTALKQPPEDDEYSITRKLALETVADLKAEVTDMQAEQKQWFKEHPASKDTGNERGPVEFPGQPRPN